MALRVKRNGLPKYRSLQSPRPQRKMVALWPKQHALSRGASEFLKVISTCLGE
jgi:hypothetical protein